jgi:hypothetical protein
MAKAKFFYNSPNKKVAVWNASKAILIRMAEEEGCEIIIRDDTGTQVDIVNKK